MIRRGKQLQVGASAKRMRALAEKRRRGLVEGYGAGGVGVADEPQTVQLLLIFFMSVAFAFVMTDAGTIDKFSRTITGNFLIDQMLIGPGIPVIFGDDTLDKIITSIIRGFAIFIISGTVPFLAKLYSRITDNAKTNVFVLHWGVLVTVPFLLYLFIGFVLPLVIEAIDIIAN